MMSPSVSIAIFSGYYPAHGGGIEIVCEKVARGLADRGFRVSWCALDDCHPLSDKMECQPLAGTDILYRLTGTPMPLPAPSAFQTIWENAKKADVVLIAEANFLTNVVAFIAAKIHRRPILLVQHLGMPSTVSRVARCITKMGERFVVRPMVRSADTAAFVSPAVKEHFDSVATKGDALVIGHGTDTQLFRSPRSRAERDLERKSLGFDAQDRVACFVGRCTVSKGAEIIAEVARRRPDWTFVIAGSGPINPADWKLSNVKMLGHIDQSRLAQLYRASDVMLLPSPSESFSLVVREALACGTNVVCGDTILRTDQKLQQYVKSLPVDLAHIEETALRFAEQLDNAPLMTTAAASYVRQNCSWDTVITQYAIVVDGLAKSRRDTKLAIA